MDSLIGYGSDDDHETERYVGHHYTGSGGGGGGSRRRDDDTNYDDVNMDMSEDSQAESEPELPQAEPQPSKHSYEDRRGSGDSRERDRDRERERDYRRRESPSRRPDRADRNDRRSPRRDKHRSDREREERGRGLGRGGYDAGSRRGLLGDRPDDRLGDKPPSLMDLKPFGGEAPPSHTRDTGRNSQDARDAVSPRFMDRGADRRDRDRDRDRGEKERDRGDRDRERSRDRSRERSHGRGEERYGRGEERYGRGRGVGAAYPPPPSTASSSGSERRGSPPSGDYRPSSYKVNRKLEVMEKMGLQIKTPDGSMATAQQLRTAASTAPPHCSGQPSYFNNATTKILDQVQKRKMLWANKSKDEAAEAAKWSGTRFAQDNDGKQVSKFMRLMGIKEPAAVKPEPADKAADPIKKQEELFQAMQAQYEVARATTHTMRGVGLGFQRGQF